MKKIYGTIILGNGIAGLGTALALQKRGEDTLIIGPAENPGRATEAASGILDPVLEIENPTHLFKMNCKAAAYYPSFLKELKKATGSDSGFIGSGLVYMALTEEHERLLKKRFAWQKKYLKDARLLSAGQLLKKWPYLSGEVRSGVYLPSVGKVHASQLKKNVLCRIRQMGGRALFGRIKHLEKDSKTGFFKVGTDRGVYFSKRIVNALGCWGSQSVGLGIKFPVRPMRGQILILKGDSRKKVIVHSLDGLYIVPFEQNRFLTGSTLENAGFRPRVTAKGIAGIRRRITRYLPETKTMPEAAAWAGLRPRARDFKPLIGKTRIENYFAAAGYYRSGILIGPYMGELLAKGILSGKMPQELKPFDPRRFKDTDNHRLILHR
ncbi:MAG: FAD-dependent oxidoreductase [Candidatus Omnitrophica bacterium]|nr:FAD-dependent oxidoreductase [Candidatus Omnitrophota bacterium]